MPADEISGLNGRHASGELAPFLCNQIEAIARAAELKAQHATTDNSRQKLCVLARHARALRLMDELVLVKEATQVPARDFIDQICEWVQAGYGYPKGVQVFTRVDQSAVAVGMAHVLGFAVNELVTNCLQHAFPKGRSGGTVEVAFDMHEPGMCQLAVDDDGVGLPDGFNLANGAGSGLAIVSALARDVGGSLEIGPGPGTRVTLRTPCI